MSLLSGPTGLLGQGFDDPRSAAVMALAGGLLQRNMGGGLLAANNAYSQAKQDALRQQMAQQQFEMQRQQHQLALGKAQRDAAMEAQMREAAQQSTISPERANAMSMGPMPDGSAVPRVQPGFDMRGYADRLMAIDPMKGLQFKQATAKDTPFTKLDPKDYTPESLQAFMQSGGRDHSLLQPRSKMEVASGFVYDPYKVKPGTVLPNPNQPFMFAPDGRIVPNTAYQQYEITKAGAAKPSVEVRVDNKMGESLAGQVGPMAKDSRVQATGAVSMFDAADRIEAALNSNKVVAGPGASKIQTVKQFVQMVGGGNDESIRQTRQVIKSLAQMSVEARKQLQGQGQVTESESAAVAKADAGDINDLTIGELRDLVTLTKRGAHFTAQGHSKIIQELASNPATQSLVPFYQVPRMDELLKYKPTLPQIGAPASPNGQPTRRYNPAAGRIE